MIRASLALTAFVFLVTPAAAASFDCSKAQSPFEKAICSSDELSRQDEILAQAYQTALGGLSETAAAEMKSAQRAWLGYAQQQCSEDARPISTPYTDGQSQCLAGVYRDRIRDLEASRMEGGFRFYPIDRYLVEKDTESEPASFNKLADKQFQSVRMDGTDDVATAFNAMADDLAIGDGGYIDRQSLTIAPGDVTSDHDVALKVDEVTGQRISLVYTEYWYGHGAAHGNYYILHHHFLLDEKRALEASDIFAGEGWEKTFGGLVLEAIKERLGEDYFDGSDEDVMKFAIDPQRWTFSEDGVTVQFNIYEVTAYAMGAPKVTIPWEAIDGLLSEHAREIAFY